MKYKAEKKSETKNSKNVCGCKLKNWGILRNKYIVLCDLGMPKAIQNSNISSMNWVMKLFFCMRSDIHKYVYLIQSILIS